MSKSFSLATLTDATPVVVQLKKSLESAVGQKIVATIVDKLKKVSGETTRTVTFSLENNQKAGFIYRKSGDIVRFQLNGKDRPIVGDLDPAYKPSYNAAITEIADIIRGNQPKFDNAKAREKVKIPQTKKDRALTTTSEIKVITAKIADLDQQITEKTKSLDLLKSQVSEIERVQAEAFAAQQAAQAAA